VVAHCAAKIQFAFAVVALFGWAFCQVATLTQGQFGGSWGIAADAFDNDLPELIEIAADISEIAHEDGVAPEATDAADAAMAASADAFDASDAAVGPDGALLPDVLATQAVVEAVDIPEAAEIANIIDAIADTPDVPVAPDSVDAAAADIDAGCDPAKCPPVACQQAYCAGEMCALKPKAGPCEDGNAFTWDDFGSNCACKGGNDSCAAERLDVTVVGGLSLTLCPTAKWPSPGSRSTSNRRPMPVA